MYSERPQSGGGNGNSDMIRQPDGQKAEDQRLDVIPPPEILVQDEEGED